MWYGLFDKSTQVEILLGYLTKNGESKLAKSTQVEILLGYLTSGMEIHTAHLHK